MLRHSLKCQTAALEGRGHARVREGVQRRGRKKKKLTESASVQKNENYEHNVLANQNPRSIRS